MNNIEIRRCIKEDDMKVLNVCYRTGYMGEDLTGRDIFNDFKLFGYLFCMYYPIYETKNCFVAIDRSKNNEVVGYIIGTSNTLKQEKLFLMRMGYRILSRIVFYTIWKHPETVKEIKFYLNNRTYHDQKEVIYKEYPGHFHINVLDGYQSMGLGKELLKKFEENMIIKKVSGIHLETSNKNVKAISFYKACGYSIIMKKEDFTWSKVSEYETIIFGKKLKI